MVKHKTERRHIQANALRNLIEQIKQVEAMTCESWVRADLYRYTVGCPELVDRTTWLAYLKECVVDEIRKAMNKPSTKTGRIYHAA